MTFPMYREIELPLLKEIDLSGGVARPADLYERLTLYFPQLTEEDLNADISSGGQNKWQNMVRWARFNLVKKGELLPSDSAGYGNWAISKLGQCRLNDETHILPRRLNKL